MKILLLGFNLIASRNSSKWRRFVLICEWRGHNMKKWSGSYFPDSNASVAQWQFLTVPTEIPPVAMHIYIWTILAYLCYYNIVPMVAHCWATVRICHQWANIRGPNRQKASGWPEAGNSVGPTLVHQRTVIWDLLLLDFVYLTVFR